MYEALGGYYYFCWYKACDSMFIRWYVDKVVCSM